MYSYSLRILIFVPYTKSDNNITPYNVRLASYEDEKIQNVHNLLPCYDINILTGRRCIGISKLKSMFS